MKQLVKESLTESGKLPELSNHRTSADSHHKGYMSINDFSEIMTAFFDAINSVKKYLDDDTIKHLVEAREPLSRAWRNEANAHGVEYEEYPFITFPYTNEK